MVVISVSYIYKVSPFFLLKKCHFLKNLGSYRYQIIYF